MELNGQAWPGAGRVGRLLLNEARAGTRFKTDFAEGRILLANVLLQHIEHRFGPVEGCIDALEIQDLHVVALLLRCGRTSGKNPTG